MGMAGVLDAARFCALAALAAGERPDAVQAVALGSHGDEMVIPLSQARIGGEPITRRLDAPTLAALVDRTRRSGAEVVSSSGRAAPTSPPPPPSRMVLAMARDTGEVLPACVRADGAYGIDGVYVGLPARLGPAGVIEVVELPLVPRSSRSSAGRRFASGNASASSHRLMRSRRVRRTRAGGLADVPDPGSRTRATPSCGSSSAPCGNGPPRPPWTPGIVPGTVLGHEFVGEVVATGAAVTTRPWGPGRRFRLHRLRPVLVVPPRGSLGVRRAPLLRVRLSLRGGAVRRPGGVRPRPACRHRPRSATRGLPPRGGRLRRRDLASGYAAAERGGVAAGDTVAIVGGARWDR